MTNNSSPLIYIVDDQLNQCIITENILRKLGYKHRFFTDPKCCINSLKENKNSLPQIIILDLIMPDMNGHELLKQIMQNWPQISVIIQTISISIEDAIIAMKLGARDYLSKPINEVNLKVSIENALKEKSLKTEIESLEAKLSEKYSFEKIIAKSSSMQKILGHINRVSNSNIPVLIYGENGTGKKLIAKTIHQLSNKKGNFINIDCSTITKNIFEKNSPIIESVKHGTLHLQNIEEINKEQQKSLLKIIEAIYNSKLKSPKIRLIVSTTKQLATEVKKGNFLPELFEILNVFPLYIPALRERKDDISELSYHFLKQAGYNHPKLNKATINFLKQQLWKNNITELKTALEHAVNLAKGMELTPSHFSFLYENKNDIIADDMENIYHEKEIITLQELEKRHICCTLSFYNFNISKTARVLNISRSTLYRKLKEHNVSIL